MPGELTQYLQKEASRWGRRLSEIIRKRIVANNGEPPDASVFTSMFAPGRARKRSGENISDIINGSGSRADIEELFDEARYFPIYSDRADRAWNASRHIGLSSATIKNRLSPDELERLKTIASNYVNQKQEKLRKYYKDSGKDKTYPRVKPGDAGNRLSEITRAMHMLTTRGVVQDSIRTDLSPELARLIGTLMLIKRLKGNTADLDKIIKAGEKSPVFQLFMEQVRKSPNQSIRQAIIPQQLLQKKQSHIIEQAGQLVHDQLKANLRNLRQISKERPSRSVTIPFGAKMREAGEQLYAPNKRIYHGVAKDTRIPQYISPIAQRQHFTPYPEIGGGYADSIMVGYPTHSLKQSPRYTAHLGMPSEAGDFERWQRQQAIKRGEYSIASPHVEWSSRPDYETVIDVPKDKLKYYLIDKNFRGIDRSKHGEGLPNGPRDQTLRGNYYDAPLKGVAQRDITITPISKQELFKHVPAAAARAQELKEHAKQLDLNLIADHLNRMTKDIFKPFSREVAPNDYW